jgi:pSer/pThr/pTyr-binding forkhead associated (FHA) protein
MPELVFLRRGAEVLRVALERPRLVLGRGEGCDVVLPDPQVSRQHVALVKDGTRWLLEWKRSPGNAGQRSARLRVVRRGNALN